MWHPSSDPLCLTFTLAPKGHTQKLGKFNISLNLTIHIHTYHLIYTLPTQTHPIILHINIYTNVNISKCIDIHIKLHINTNTYTCTFTHFPISICIKHTDSYIHTTLIQIYTHTYARQLHNYTYDVLNLHVYTCPQRYTYM